MEECWTADRPSVTRRAAEASVATAAMVAALVKKWVKMVAAATAA